MRSSPRIVRFSLSDAKYTISGVRSWPYRSMRPFRCWNTINDQGMSKWMRRWQRKCRLMPSEATSEQISRRTGRSRLPKASTISC